MSEITRTKSAHSSELIAFRIGTQDFCIDVMSVREIRGWTPTTTLPQAPSFVRGVINLRGAVLPIVDLAARLGFPAAEPSARHVIIVTQVGNQVGNQFVGLLVDAVSDILTATDDLIQPTPSIASDTAKAFVRGILAIEGRMISVIEIDSILPGMQLKAA
ncbi:MAG: chemotaxis protein CheW [Beijerinckiaceae bacterium]